MSPMQKIPLSGVAPDIRPLIQAYREGGEISFQDVSVETARANYILACERNGLPRVALRTVRNHEIAVGGGTISLREYRDDIRESMPAILFIHGGGWVIGNLDTHDAICRTLAKESQAAVFAVDYRLAPEYPFPTPLEDCKAALNWLVASGRELGIDPMRVGIVGDSAGGNLATVLANSDELQPPGFMLQALVLFYPVTDLSRESSSYGHISTGFPLTAGTMRWFRQHYVPSETAFADARLSPLLTPGLSRAPLFILSCGLDPLAEEGCAYAGKAIEAGIRVEHHHLPNHPHGILTSAGRVATGKAMVLKAAAFLRDLL